MEGMPFRLVIAVAMGAAAVGLLVPMAAQVEQSEEAEITATIDPEKVVLDNETAELTITVQTEAGEPVEGASVVLSDGSLPIADGPVKLETGPESNELTATVGTTKAANVTVAFRERQPRGSVDLRLRPPPESDQMTVSTAPDITVIEPETTEGYS